MVDEILEDCPQVNALVTSVGGGGLLAYLDHPAIAQAHDVVIVVCGGVSITPALVAGRGMLEATPVKQGRAGNAVRFHKPHR
jgi:threonine dehydratase